MYKRRLTAEGNPIDEGEKHDVGPETQDHPLVSKHGKDLENGTYCGSCYGSEDEEGDCCNTCDEVRPQTEEPKGAFVEAS